LIATVNKELSGQFVTTALERKLKADKQGTLRDQVVGDLSKCAVGVQQKKHSGLPPDDFFKMEKMLSCLRVAEQVVRRTWNHFHSA
jgi:hypothetical protein